MQVEQKRAVKVSKFLSFVLRHKPEAIGLTLDAEGWADIETLMDLAAKDCQPFNRIELDHVVATCEKQRFAISEDGKRIRANQGHSAATVRRTYDEGMPPCLLFHGTATRFLDSIREKGLVRGERHHVHLSSDLNTARSVGQRHGSPAVLTVRALDMFEKGFKFFLSENGVWLIDHVPAEYLNGI